MVEQLIYYFYLHAKNYTQSLKEASLINVSNLNSTSNKTVNLLISRNISGQSKISISASALDELSAAVTAEQFDNTTISVFLHILILILYSILIFISLTSNPLLIYVLLIKRKTQLKLIDVFVINLSISDFFLTIFNIPLCLTIFFSGKWLFGTFICKLGTYSTSSAIYINILTMAYISVDRYFAVTRPLISNRSTNLRINTYNFDYATKRKMYIALAVIWIVAFIISIPQFIFTKIAKIDGNIANEEEFLASASDIMVEELLGGDQASNSKFNLEKFNIDYFITPSVTEDFNNGKSEVHFSKFGEGLMNRCTMEYPLLNMKFYMVILNFSLQYLLPSLVILFFYGKIIYHLYLNLNIEALFQTTSSDHDHNHQNGTLSNSADSIHHYGNDSNGKKSCCSAIFFCQSKTKTSKVKSENNVSNHHHAETDIPLRARSKGSLMRVEGINRSYNLKKSIKIMIIIITSFLISWLPIHLYRLVTTFHPFFTNKISESKHTLNIFDNEMQFNLKNCTIENFIQCLYFDDDINSSRKEKTNYTTIHNRYLFFFFHFLSMSSVCYNPIVYFWLHKKFRKEVQLMMSKICSAKTFIRNNTINKVRKRSNTATTTSSAVTPIGSQRPPVCLKMTKFNGTKNGISNKMINISDGGPVQKNKNHDNNKCNKKNINKKHALCRIA